MRQETHQEATFRSTIAQQEVRRLARAGRQDSVSFALALKASNPERQQVPTNVADCDAMRSAKTRQAPELPPLRARARTLSVVPVQPSPDDLFTVAAHVVFTGSAGA